jgi:hypothetical protein
VKVPEAGTYRFWCRAMGEAFRWAWNDGVWGSCTTQSDWGYETKIRDMDIYELSVSWVCLGEVTLPAGKQLLRVRPVDEGEGSCVGIDCWLLTRKPFTPNGADKPAAR